MGNDNRIYLNLKWFKELKMSTPHNKFLLYCIGIGLLMLCSVPLIKTILPHGICDLKKCEMK